jgi:16S rRNA (adenine(1408)-N(1))-methyltransferase
VIVDLGTGDGRAVLARAASDPDAFVIGIDANAAAMADASRRANRPRTRVANAVFMAGAAESLPGPLAGAAALVTVTMPWGSLLRGVLGLDDRALRGVASIVAPSGCVEVLASVVPSDQVDDLDAIDRDVEAGIANAWRRHGLELASMCLAGRDDLLATHSSWARRLGERPVWRLTFRRHGRTTSRAHAQDGGH